MQRIGYSTVYLFAWWLCIVSMPWYVLPHSISVVLLLGVWLAGGNFPEKWSHLKSKTWVWPFIIFFFLHVIGLLYSEDMASAIFNIETKLSLILLPLIAATGPILSNGSFRLLKNSFIGSCLVVSLASLIAAMNSFLHPAGPVLNFDPYTTEKFHSLFPTLARGWEYFSYGQLSQWIEIHPAFFSMYLILCILIIMQGIFDEQRTNFFQVVLIIFFISFISLLASRMAVVSLIVTVTFLVLHHSYLKKRLLRGLSVLSFLLVLTFFFIWINPVSRFRVWIEPMTASLTADEHTAHWNSINLHLLSWKASSGSTDTNWPFGAGTGDGQHVLYNYYASLGILGFKANAHNQYLQTFIELGIVGVISLSFCLYAPAYRAFKNNPLHFAFIVLFGMMCLSESMLVRPMGIAFFAMFQSLFLCNKAQGHE